MTKEQDIKNKLFEGKNILVVDDEIMVSKFISVLLKSRGCNVTTMNKSTEALSYFCVHKDEIDLVITDQTMPEMNGSELAQEMFLMKPEIAIFITTGFSEEIDEETALKMGIKSFLTKPIKSAILLEHVSNIF